VIIKKTRDEIERMARAGAVVAKAHEALIEQLKPGMTTLDLDAIAEKVIVGEGAVPSFKGYRGFPATLCTSKNHEIVHGIPSSDVRLDEGDVISIDCGAIVEGFHGDSATTLIVGGEDAVDPAVATLIRETRNAMWRGLEQVQHGNRLGDVGSARSRPSPTVTGTAWCASTWVTASAGRCTRTPRCPTTAPRAAGRSSPRGG
jgi:methionyl aminopeptidase